MSIETAIKLAIESGWHSGLPIVECEEDLHRADILLDKNFWQALGKSCGWSDEPYQYTNEHDIPGWHIKWLMLIDHLADNGTIESYFASLPTEN